MEGGIYGPGLYAKVVVDRVLVSIPLRRQERVFERLGAPIPVGTLCALYHRASELLDPIYKALMAHVATSEHVNADETPLPVLDEQTTRKGWMWVFATDGALLFKHSPSRGKSVPEEVLDNTTGTLTVDGYTAYNSVTGDQKRQRGGCWCHARRGIYNARHQDEAFADAILNDISTLFDVEEDARDTGIRGTVAHLALRTEKSGPVIKKLYSRLEKYTANLVDERGSLAKAVQYALNQRDPLQLFLTDPAVPIHNNLSERSLRIVALMRKNSLFAGSDEAAQSYAKLLSLLATCRLHDVDPEKWVADVLIAIGEPGLIAQDLLSWNWKATRAATFSPLYHTT